MHTLDRLHPIAPPRVSSPFEASAPDIATANATAFALAKTPGEVAALMERYPFVPSGPGHWLAGYGIIGVPFESGDVLALLRFVGSSIGPPYTAVWHRDRSGIWRVFADVEAPVSRPRFAVGGTVSQVPGPVSLRWSDPNTLHIGVPAAPLHWTVNMSNTRFTSALNQVLRNARPPVMYSRSALRVLELMGRLALRTGRLTLRGAAGSRDEFAIYPQQLWRVEATEATLDGRSLGDERPLATPASLGDFRIPQRGIFAAGTTMFGETGGPSQPEGVGSQAASRLVVLSSAGRAATDIAVSSRPSAAPHP